jgi:fatty-acyl-CoA synthase
VRVHDFLSYWAVNAPERVCVEDGARTLTYRDTEERARRVAVVLTGLGVARGARIAVLAKNSVEWAPLYYGAFKVGAVPVPLNFRLHPREWAYQLADSSSAVVLVQEPFLDGIDQIRHEFPDVTFVAIGAQREGWKDYEELLANADPDSFVDPGITESDDLYQMYTSGTTGRPKGAIITHGAGLANLVQIRTFLPLSPGEGTLLVAPLFHAAAAVSLFWYVSCGATVHVQPDFDPEACLDLLASGDVASATFVPAMIQMIVNLPSATERDYSGLRNMIYGASPIAEEVLRKALGIFSCDFVQGYGQTECCSTLTFLGPEEHRRALQGEPHLLLSCGRPVVGTDIRIVTSDGDVAAVGEVGEILARGPQVMRGYWNLPEATEATLAGGWLHTGDAGYLDEGGHLYISDRVKDLIVSGGENVYPREIEDVLMRLEGVLDVAVIGVPHEKWGEAVKAVVVGREAEALTAEEVIAHCKSELAGFKVPGSVDFVVELPRNATGKVLKTTLREPYWAGHARRVAG